MIRSDRKKYVRVLLPLSAADAATPLARADMRSLSQWCGIILTKAIADKMEHEQRNQAQFRK